MRLRTNVKKLLRRPGYQGRELERRLGRIEVPQKYLKPKHKIQICY